MTRRHGFTLIELVVVIMILGILAGVAAPKLFNTSGQAKENGLKQTLAIVRDAIELYNAKYGTLPPCSTATDFQTALKEFMRGEFPICPVGAANGVVKATTGATTVADDDAAKAWMYNTTNGTFIVNCTDATLTAGVTYDEL